MYKPVARLRELPRARLLLVRLRAGAKERRASGAGVAPRSGFALTGSQIFYADVLPNGSFIAEIPPSLISSGLSVKVYDPDGAPIGEWQDGIPEKQITQGLTLKISGGILALAFGEGLAGKTGALFNSQDRLASPAVIAYKISWDAILISCQAGRILSGTRSRFKRPNRVMSPGYYKPFYLAPSFWESNPGVRS